MGQELWSSTPQVFTRGSPQSTDPLRVSKNLLNQGPPMLGECSSSISHTPFPHSIPSLFPGGSRKVAIGLDRDIAVPHPTRGVPSCHIDLRIQPQQQCTACGQHCAVQGAFLPLCVRVGWPFTFTATPSHANPWVGGFEGSPFDAFSKA